MHKSLYVYGDPSNHTLRVCGDNIDESYWATICEEGETSKDVMVFSDGTVLEFYLEDGDPLYHIRALAEGPAFKGIEKFEDESDEASLEGEIHWVLTGFMNEMLRTP